MLRYVIKRILLLIPVILAVAFIVFMLMELAPGDIVDTMRSEDMTPEDVEALRRQYNLHRPVVYRYAVYMINLVQGDLGISYVSRFSVWDTYISRLPNTLILSFSSLIIGSLAAVTLGITAAKRAGKLVDNATTTFSLIGMSMPGFWLGLLLLLVFSLRLGWLPAGGNTQGIRSLILPVICSSLMLMGTATRQTRSSMLEVLKSDYLRTARAKGVPEKVVINKHALGNAWIPILTTIGTGLSVSLAGSVVVESVFAWPGVGRMAAEAVMARDIPATLGCVILTTILYVLVHLLVDLCYAFVDPRIKSQYVTKRKKKGEGVKEVKIGSFETDVFDEPTAPETQHAEPDAAPARLSAEAPEKVATVSEPAKNEPEARSFVTVFWDPKTGEKIGGSQEASKDDRKSDPYELVSKKYRKRSQFGEIVHHMSKNKGAITGLAIIALMLVALVASLLMSFESVTAMDVPNRFAEPSLKFPFGADGLGRNVFLRAIYGTRYSLSIGLGVVAISVIFGTTLGSIAGYYGGIVDDIIMRVSDTLASIPGMLLGMVIVTVLGMNLQNLIIAVGVTSVPIFIRITRASILTVRNNEYVEAARAIGFADPRIVLTQVLPNGLAPIIVTITASFGIAILIGASLSFLGYGVPVPHPEWGAMISNGREFMHRAPWLMTYPGLLIMLTVLGFNLLGDGLRDALDPKLKK